MGEEGGSGRFREVQGGAGRFWEVREVRGGSGRFGELQGSIVLCPDNGYLVQFHRSKEPAWWH
jgi:hypothetical protein